MTELVNFLFDTSQWPPRWYCGNWTEALGWTHIVSDTLIFLAYFTIPCILLYFYRQIKGFQIEKVFILFALFIVFCGIGHLVEAVIFYYPVYRFAGFIKASTALVSWATVIALAPYIKKMILFPKIEIINQKLMRQLEEERGQLHQTLNELIESNETLNAFSHRVAHDLKEPIRGVNTYATILLENDMHKEAREPVEKILQLSAKSMEMISDILNYSIVEREKRISSPVEVAQLLHEIIDEVPDPGQCIQFRIEEDIPDAIGNRVVLKEVFRNLIMNGIKYNEQEKKVIEVGFEKKESASAYFIRDNGIGISKEGCDHLFESKYDTHPGCQIKGTGFGLMMVKKAVEKHGGQIWVESVLGKGSTVYFTLSHSQHLGSK